MSATIVSVEGSKTSETEKAKRVKRYLTSQFSFKTSEDALRALKTLQSENFGTLERILATP